MESEKLVGTYRIGPRECKPLPVLRMPEKEEWWNEKNRTWQVWVYLTTRLISDDEISDNLVVLWNIAVSDNVLEFHPVSWTLKRQK